MQPLRPAEGIMLCIFCQMLRYHLLFFAMGRELNVREGVRGWMDGDGGAAEVGR